MRPIFLITFLLAASFASGQKLHELKTDVVLPFFDIAHLSYEFNPAGRFGMEANLWYSWAEQGGYYIPPPILFNDAEGTYIPTKQQVLIYAVAAKYYFSQKANGTGLYLGGYLRQDVLVSHRDSRYRYFSLNNYIAYDQNIGKQKTLRSAIGLLAGYKCLIGKHLIMEAGIGVDLNLRQKFKHGNDYIDWMGIPLVRAGYRF